VYAPDSATPTIQPPQDLTLGAWQEAMSILESIVATGVDVVRVDGSQLGPIAPLLLQHLSAMFDRCLDARAVLRIENASPELTQMLDLLYPRMDLTATGSIGIGAAHVMASYSSAITPQRQNVKAAVEHLLFLLNDLKLSNRTVYLIRSLVEEVMSNISLHSGLKDDARVFLHLRVESTKTVMVVVDDGIPFDPTTWNARTGPVARPPGDPRLPFGIKLLNRLSSRMEYFRMQDAVNVLMLERTKRRSAWQAEAWPVQDSAEG
jgi:anti-sigma regulatory factor (Ser/Thr protein kinase)